MFDMMDAARLEGLHLAQDPATGLKAIIAIHSTRLGPALGGCRYLPYPNDEAAIGDAIRLAQGMSYKAALAGLEQGGGKAVIIRPPHLDNRGALFEAFGRFIESLGGRYITAVDSGTSSADMDCIAQQTRHVTSTTQAGDPSPHTALGVFAGIRASAQARLGSDDLEGLRVAVQGLGHVGYALAEQLAAVGAELLVCDLDPGRVQLAVEHARCPSAGAGGIALHPLRHPRALRPGRRAHQPERQPVALRGGGRGGEQPVGAAGGRRRAGGARHPLCAGLRDQLRRPDLRRPQAPRRRSAQHHRALWRAFPRGSPRSMPHAQADHQSPARIADRLAERILYGPQ
ncbi:leucine dehydrogenase [Pseudomonas aeruginosa C3719]|nr:leucine dehydrogenase [Pseudomonas aeruginosa C3719]